MPLVSVLEAVEQQPAPISPGCAAAALSRGSSTASLSVDEMMRAAKSQFGRVMDEEQEEALRNAFAAIKDDEKRSAADAAAKGGYESGTLQGLAAPLSCGRLWARALERVGSIILNRALLDRASRCRRRSTCSGARSSTRRSSRQRALDARPRGRQWAVAAEAV